MRWVALTALLMAGCPSGTPRGPAGDMPPLAEDVARLTVPASDETAGALQRLRARAEAGERDAAWARLHYLIDLFDDARFRGAADSRALVLAATAVSEGDDVTDAVLDALLVDADALLAGERLHARAQAARTLLAHDREPPARRADVLQRMAELKRIARGGGELAGNARLRLAAFCARALSDAAAAPAPARPGMIAMCLYAVYDADPEPYFAADPELRPPAPAWQHLADATADLLVDHGGRTALAAAAMAEALAAFRTAGGAALPTPHSPQTLGVPFVDRAAVFDGGPLLALGDGRALRPRAEYVATLRPTLTAERGGAVAVALHGAAPAQALYTAAGAVGEAGGDRLLLAVGFRQRLQAPPGDYWHGRLTDGTAARVGVIPVSLAPPARASLGVHLVVSGDTWRVIAPEGELASIPAGDREALAAALAHLRAAFPDEDGLFLAIEPGATYASVVAAADVATRGDHRFELALASAGPEPKGSGLRARVDRRAAARVEIAPAELARRAPVLRRCYLALVDASPRAGGELHLELRGDDVVVASGPRDRKLRACALDAVAEPMKRGKIATATVKLLTR